MTASSRTSIRDRSPATLLIAVLAAFTMLFGACGGDAETVRAPEQAATPGTTDQTPGSGSDGGSDGFVLDLDLGEIDGVGTDDDPLPIGPPGSNETGSQNLDLTLVIPTPTPVPVIDEEPPPAAPTPVQLGVNEDPDPLETVIIDDRPTTVDTPSFELDQNAALACANAEFALDALIANDSAALDNALDQAAAWAQQSQDSGMRDIAGDLASTRDPVEAERLVLAVLQACTSAGYEL